MRRVLIISPHFPPVNAADMQRVRQVLPYLKENNWDAEVITVDPKYIESYSKDELLLKTIPNEIQVHYVKALDPKFTRRLGLGSLSMRSFFHFKRAGNILLKQKKFDLIFFSTTAFHVMALGPYWKKKFKVPFVLDIQDPWRNDYYLDKPKSERPPKFFISYNIDKFLERFTVPKADGIISVSTGYCDEFSKRYKNFSNSKCLVLPFGALALDFEIMRKYIGSSTIQFDTSKKNIVYIGRGGYDMKFSLQLFFTALKNGLKNDPNIFSNVHCWFIGTSYALEGKGTKTILPVAQDLGISCITEITDRLPYFETLFLLTKADLLFIPGSIDKNYTASKIYPYVIAGKPLLSIFYSKSSVVKFLRETNAGTCITFDNVTDMSLADQIEAELEKMLQHPISPVLDQEAFENYSARRQAGDITVFFEKVRSN